MKIDTCNLAKKELKKLPVNVVIRVSIDEKACEGGVGMDVKHHVQLVLAFKHIRSTF